MWSFTSSGFVIVGAYIGTDQRSLLFHVLFISGNICLYFSILLTISAFNVLLLHCIVYRNNYIHRLYPII